MSENLPEKRGDNGEPEKPAIRDEKGRYLKGAPRPRGGRPKGSVSIVKHIRAALEELDEAQAKMLAKALILQAAKGNGTAIKQIMDRIDGPITEKVEGVQQVIVTYEREGAE